MSDFSPSDREVTGCLWFFVISLAVIYMAGFGVGILSGYLIWG